MGGSPNWSSGFIQEFRLWRPPTYRQNDRSPVINCLFIRFGKFGFINMCKWICVLHLNWRIKSVPNGTLGEFANSITRPDNLAHIPPFNRVGRSSWFCLKIASKDSFPDWAPFGRLLWAPGIAEFRCMDGALNEPQRARKKRPNAGTAFYWIISQNSLFIIDALNTLLALIWWTRTPSNSSQ